MIQTNSSHVALTGTPVLETARMTLRAPQGGDWPFWRDFVTSDRARHIGGPMLVAGQAWRAFGHVIGHWAMRGFGMFVMVDRADGRRLGLTGPWFPDGWAEREIGWNLWLPEAEGKGFAQEGARATLDHAFNHLNWDTAVSYISAQNAASIRLAERLGARPDPTARQPDIAGAQDIVIYRHPKGAA